MTRISESGKVRVKARMPETEEKILVALQNILPASYSKSIRVDPRGSYYYYNLKNETTIEKLSEKFTDDTIIDNTFVVICEHNVELIEHGCNPEYYENVLGFTHFSGDRLMQMCYKDEKYITPINCDEIPF